MPKRYYIQHLTKLRFLQMVFSGELGRLGLENTIVYFCGNIVYFCGNFASGAIDNRELERCL